MADGNSPAPGRFNFTNILIIAILVFLVVIQFFRPWGKNDGKNEFEEQYKKTQEMLARFDSLNNDLKLQTNALDLKRRAMDSTYYLRLGEFNQQINRLQTSLQAVKLDYKNLAEKLERKEKQLRDLGAPDVLPSPAELNQKKGDPSPGN